MAAAGRTLIIACGALAREVKLVLERNRLDGLRVTCLPADLHNRPQKIPAAMREKIRANRDSHDRIIALYGDCGTGGELDRVLAEEGVERIAGPHCYDFYAGHAAFEAMVEDEIGSFFLTDYLVRFFDRLIWQGLGIDRHPELKPMYFGHYRRLVYLAQIKDEALEQKAREAADRLGLEYEYRFTGLDGIERFLVGQAAQTATSDA